MKDLILFMEKTYKEFGIIRTLHDPKFDPNEERELKELDDITRGKIMRIKRKEKHE